MQLRHERFIIQGEQSELGLRHIVTLAERGDIANQRGHDGNNRLDRTYRQGWICPPCDFVRVSAKFADMQPPAHITRMRDSLRRLMQEKGIKPTTLSQALGPSKTLLSEVLTKNNDIKLSTVSRLAQELGVSMEAVLGMEAPRPWAPREDTIRLVLESGLLPLTASHVPPDDLQLLAHAVTKGLQLVAAQPAMEDDPGFRKAVETTIANAIADYRQPPAQSA